jgi:hypothetical protein
MKSTDNIEHSDQVHFSVPLYELTWQVWVTAIRRFPDYRSELAEQQSENVLELAFSPAQLLRPLRRRCERWSGGHC